MRSILRPLPFLLLACGALAQEPLLPIIDMHLHARDAPDPERELPPTLCLPITVPGVANPQCADPLVAPATDAAMVERTVDILHRRNIFA